MNRLEVSLQQAIIALHGRGWSQRRIARELHINRETVAVHVHAAKPAISTTGSNGGRVSLCREHLASIAAAVTAGLSAKRTHQDLVREHGFAGSSQSVKRCVRSLGEQLELPHRRLE